MSNSPNLPGRASLTLILLAVVVTVVPVAAQTTAVPVLPTAPYSYSNIQFPVHFSVSVVPPGGAPVPSVLALDDTPGNNPTTDAGVTLGRVLFYDTNLSKTRTVSCSSCHQQAHGFSDPQRVSTGFAGGQGTRHATGLSNSRFNPGGKVFWDERATSLEDQALKPIQDAVEMGLTLPELEQRVAALSYYPALFTAAFGDPSVNSTRIAKAIAQFDRALVSYRSRYDVGRVQVANPGVAFPNFTNQENRGKTLFLTPPPQGGANCIACHRTEAFLNDQGPINNGLNADSSADPGAFAITGNPQDRGSFRFPSLRDIATRAPFMHDGRFATLNDVVDFYDHGVQNNPNLDQRLRGPGGQPLRLNLSGDDRAALVAFLNTFTDTQLISDPHLSDPFRALRTVSSASQAPGFAAPDSIATATGTDLALTITSATAPLPNILATVQVLVRDSNNVERAAALYYVSPTQINYVIPRDTALGAANVSVLRNGVVVSQGPLTIISVVPAIYTANGDGKGVPAAYAVSADVKGNAIYTPTFRALAQGYAPASIPLGLSDVVLELYGTGLRNASKVTAMVGGLPAEVVYVGAHSVYPGLDQINVKVPGGCSGKGTVSLVLTVTGADSNAVDLAF